MPARGSLRAPELKLAAAGALITLVASFVAVDKGATLGIEVLGVLLVLVGSAVAYLAVPHGAIAGTIVLFAAVPALKVFVSPSLGGIKDVVCIGAICAGAILVGFEKRRMDRGVAVLVAIFIALYVINPGHPHDSAWAQGVRLTGEPMLLLLVGFLLPDPQRNLRWGLGAFAATGIVVALYGILQQALGPNELVSLGYVYGDQVRTIGSELRSFGTLDDPFSYAAFLYFAVAATFFCLRRGWLLWVCELILLLGLAVSFVRTAGLVLLGFLALVMIAQRRTFPALCLIVAVGVTAGLTLSHSSGVQTQSLTVYYRDGGSAVITSPVDDPGGVLLNGRVSAWTAAVGSDPLDWVFGRGVGTVGTAADRARAGVLTSGTSSSSATSATPTTAVDSGYLATVADIGIVGLLVQLALFWRLVWLGAQRVRAGRFDGWIPVTLMTALLLDALTRASFTGFPTAFVGFLLVGVSVAAIDRPATRSISRRLASARRPRTARSVRPPVRA